MIGNNTCRTVPIGRSQHVNCALASADTPLARGPSATKSEAEAELPAFRDDRRATAPPRTRKETRSAPRARTPPRVADRTLAPPMAAPPISVLFEI